MKSKFEKALALHRSGDLGKAESIYKRILKSQPHHADTIHLIGLVRLQRGDSKAAIRRMKEAIGIAPMNVSYHESLAEAYHRIGEIDLAGSECRLALRLDSKLHKPLNLLGLLALDRCDYESALDWFGKALRARKPYPDAMVNLSVALNRIGDHKRAKEICEILLKIEPDSSRAWTNLGMAYKGMHKLREAKEAFLQAGGYPLAEFNLGYVHLLEDDLSVGLPLCEARKRLLNLGNGLGCPEWNGRSHPKRHLLVIHEQGMGDTILMSRFYPQLRERFGAVTVLVQKPLERIIQTVDPEIRIVTELNDLRYDFWCPTMSLPLLLGIDSVEKIVLEPWLRVPSTLRATNRPRVGLNWAGNPRFSYDYVRSTHLEKLAPLLQVREVEWVSLHKGHLEAEARSHGLPEPLEDAADFYATAQVLKGCDLVISTETAIPNLSAALGVPTCVLTGIDHDWRWGAWYGNVTICEQEAPGNWFGPIAKALELIRDLVNARRAA